MTARVINVQSDSSDPEWTITVVREGQFRHMSSTPLAADVPTDIRAALRAWLDTAEETP